MPDVNAFLERWRPAQAAELANAQPFLLDLCDVLGVPRPDPTTADPGRDGYVFERPVTFHDTGREAPGRIDLYRRGAFVLETKQGAGEGAKRAGHGKRETAAWERALTDAKMQAQRYAQNLEPGEPVPPFLVVVDAGYCLDLYSDFSGAGRLYTPFPDARRFRVPLDALARDDVRETLRLVWTDPHALDPTKRQARVTRALASQLAAFAASLEATTPEADRPEVPRFVTRCLFCLFAEDAGLLPERAFSRLLAAYRDALDVLPHGLAGFFATLDKGGFSPELKAVLPPFNGDLFKDARALPLTLGQLDGLLEASRADWRDVEPAIFGTLLERALSPRDRGKLGAHFTPRAYVERLVLPAVIEPLRAEWEQVQADVAAAVEDVEGLSVADARRGGRGTKALGEAAGLLRAFLSRLARVRVLDPACGSGNFLYVTLDHLKRLEAEVVRALERYAGGSLEIEQAAVTPANLLGIEVNPRAAAVADLVLWIGYLQWHLRTYGSPQTLPRPILQAYGNVRAADAVLAYDRASPRLGPDGEPVTRWDGVTTKKHLSFGLDVPDETARVPVLDYENARRAGAWPAADFIVGNPPFIGSQMMRDKLGDGYVEALRGAYEPDVPGSADFVAYWWHRAAATVRAGGARRFGFITSNSIRQTFNRRVLERHLAPADGAAPLALAYAVPDHPWVDSTDGAAVRVAFTVGVPGPAEGTLTRVVAERERGEDDARAVETADALGTIHADLTLGVDTTRTAKLRANERLSFMGVKLVGDGFVVTAAEAQALGLGRVAGLDAHVRPFRNGKDLTTRPRGVFVLDFFGLGEADVRDRFPAAYQHLLTTVRPGREAKRGGTSDATDYANRWLEHAKPRPKMRAALVGLNRYVATSEVAKHRLFTFLDGDVLPDGALIIVASDDAYTLGVLSSRAHVAWALALGGRMGMGNDPRYNSTRCFETFPFPDATEEQRVEIRALGERLDRHRKDRQAEHPALGLTDLYNVVEALRAGRPLTAKERAVDAQGLASLLLDLHRQLDAAVLRAYGWPETTPDDDVLARLVALNAERQREEQAGHVRWLRPAFQAPATAAAQAPEGGDGATPSSVSEDARAAVWPSRMADRAKAVRALLLASPSPLTAEVVAARFDGAAPSDVADVLDTLAALDQVREAEPGRFIVAD